MRVIEWNSKNLWSIFFLRLDLLIYFNNCGKLLVSIISVMSTVKESPPSFAFGPQQVYLIDIAD